MTDHELVEKRLAFIETCLRDLEREARPDELEVSVRERRFVEHTLQLAIQATLDVASHVVSEHRLGEPRTNRELFDLLARAATTEVDLAIVRDVLANRLTDLRDFIDAMRNQDS